MARRGPLSAAKRKREADKREKRKAKEEKRAMRAEEKARAKEAAANPDAIDPATDEQPDGESGDTIEATTMPEDNTRA